MLRLLALLALPLLLGDCGHPAPVRINARGAAYIFSQHGGALPDAEVTILELPGEKTISDANGQFHFDGLPGDTDLTFVVRTAKVMETLTRTFRAHEDIENVVFQAPDFDTVSLLTSLTNVQASPERCQIATTVTRAGITGNDLGGNGEPGTMVTIDPPLPEDATGPVYFAHVSDHFIFPDPSLTTTSEDGGVLFLNVPPGNYVLRAHKEDTTFSEARIKCTAGRLTNAAPPWGLAVLSGGIGPRVDGGL